MYISPTCIFLPHVNTHTHRLYAQIGKKFIFVGGSSGIGKAAALLAAEAGAEVLLISRSQDNLIKARDEIWAMSNRHKTKIELATLDFTVEADVAAFFSSLAANMYDGMVISAFGRAHHQPFLEMDTEKMKQSFTSKFWGPYHCARHGASKLRAGAGIVFFSGVLNRRPGMNCSPLASVNGAIEGLTRSLALELGPHLRVNCFSPGFIDTERFDHMTQERKQEMLQSTGDSLPLRRVGSPKDAAEGVLFLLTNQFTTGIVLDVDGGHQIRQYALHINPKL